MNDEIKNSKTSTLAIVSFVLGMLSLLFGILHGIPAVICGRIAQYNIINSNKKLKGAGLSLAGIIAGVIGVSFYFIFKASGI